MTCKRSKIISDPQTIHSIFYSYAFLPLLIVYLCIPIVSLIKYIYTDVIKAYNRESKDDPKTSNRTSQELIKLKMENAVLKEEMQRRKYMRDMLSVLKNYENTLQRFVEQHKSLLIERDTLRETLSTLKDNYHILTLKYDKAKEVIGGLESNEESLRKHLYEWEETVRSIEQRYERFKDYAVNKIDSANNHIISTDTEYKHEICKLKTKVIESQIRINDLESQISQMSFKGSKAKLPNYIFEPLISNIH